MKSKYTVELATEFLSKDYRTFDTSELPDGTIVNMSVWAFFKLDNPYMWVSIVRGRS